MEVFENENKEFDMSMVDFPFICRICLKRSDLRFFKAEDYLLDVLLTLTNIDVRSTTSLPKNICTNCIKTLEDISVFTDVSKYNAAEWEKNFMHKNENGRSETGECETYQKPVNGEKIEEYNEDLQYFKGLEICRLCYSTNLLKPVEKNEHLMQLFQNITNIDVKAEVAFSNGNNICNRCIKKLETISLFISASLCNEIKLKNVIERNENCSGGNAIDLGYLKEVKKDDDFDKNPHCFEIKSLHTIINIKEETGDTPEACMGKIHSEKKSSVRSSKDELSTETQVPYIEWYGNSSTRGGLLQQNMLVLTEETPFKCDFCEKSFGCKGNLHRHMRTHSIEKPFECDGCKKTFRWKSNLQEHMHIHSGEKPFKCDCCEKSFTAKSRLEEHMRFYSGEKPFTCDCCDKSFNAKSKLHQHMRIHSEEKPFKCDSCDKCFSWKGNLQQHMLTHSIKKPFKCDSCEKSFTLKHILKRHSLIHAEEKPFKCSHCEKSFNRKCNLNQHMLVHSAVKQFKCDCCGKAFNFRGNLQQHMHIHSGEKPFECDRCEKSFSLKGNLLQHMLVHSGEKPFKCDYCEKLFTHRNRLERHLLVHSSFLE